MRDKIQEIVVKAVAETIDLTDAIDQLLDLFSVIDSFNIDGSELNKEDQFHLQRLFRDGKVKIKISL